MRNQNKGVLTPPIKLIVLSALLCVAIAARTQVSKDVVGTKGTIPSRAIHHLQSKTNTIAHYLDQDAKRRLRKLHKLEERMRRRLPDNLRHNWDMPAFPNYADVLARAAETTPLNAVYSGRLDSLTTVLNMNKVPGLGLHFDTGTADSALAKLTNLQKLMNGREQTATLLQERVQQMQSTLSHIGFTRKLQRYQKQVFYYRSKFEAYKQLIEAPDRWASVLLAEAQKLPQFQSFFARNSQLGQLFALPGAASPNTPATGGLQTRAALAQGFRDRFGNTADLNAILQQNLPAPGNSLGDLRGRAEGYATGMLGGSGNLEMPQGFKPNEQQTRSFWKRLELGTNFQSQRARNFFPATSDLGLSIGYKLNDRSVIGVGASYKLGWGRSWDHILLSHQGVGLRSYIDVQLKGSLYVSGGYEQHYRTAFNNIAALKQYSAWQSSGLLGLTKKYKMGKLNGNMQLLWDFLSYRQVPRTQAVLWRVGYQLK